MGEQPLPPYGACLLGSLNLVKYLIKDSRGNWVINYDLMKHDIPAIIRAMDNVIDRTVYPLVQQMEEAKNKRRMGIGLTGVANAIETVGYPYGSQSFLRTLEEVLTVLRDTAYRSSVSLSIEKGPFPLFNKKLLESEFAKTLPLSIREDIELYGLRNSHLLSIAPTGTISFCAGNISSGIEPVFSMKQERKVKWTDREDIYVVTDYAYREFGTIARTSEDCTVDDHVNTLVLASRYVDSACSKTCNVGESVTWDEFKEVYLKAYRGGASGCTTYRSGGKRGGILTSTDKEKEEGEIEEGTACYIDPDTGLRSCE